MCGIAGFGTMTDVTRAMIPHLIWEIDNRGRDSWAASNGTDTIKELGSILDTYPIHDDEVMSWDRVIFHTRGASTDDITLETQHPFVFTQGEGENWVKTVVGVHNGIVANHEELCKKYDRKFRVDSMHIYAHLAADLPTSEIYGWGNLAWYEFSPKHPNGLLYLLRFNNDALHIGMLETGELVFCSTPDPIARAARFVGSKLKLVIKTEENKLYRVESQRDNEGVWVRDAIYDTKTTLPFGYRHYQSQNSFVGWGDGGGCQGRNVGRYYDPYAHNRKPGTVNIHNVQMDSRNNNMCASVTCDNPVRYNRKTNLLCERCLTASMVAAQVTIDRLNKSNVI